MSAERDSPRAPEPALDPYRPPADPTDFVDMRPPHSKLAIVSFVCGGVAIAAFAAYVASAAYIGLTGFGGERPVGASTYVAAGGMIASAGSSALGTALGVASLFQKQRRRILGVIGLAASGIVFGFYVVVLAIALAALASISSS